MAVIYIVDISSSKDVFLSLIPFFSEQKREKILKIKNDEARVRAAASQTLLCYCLDLELSCDYKLDKNSKPYIPTKPFFNISHSGNFVVCAVSNKEVGVDIEKISRMKIQTMRKIFSPKELAEAQTVSGAPLQRLLCEKWTRKESFLKLTGQGLSRPMPSINFDADTCTTDENVFSKLFDLKNGYLLCFCRHEPIEVSIKEVNGKLLTEKFSEENV